jgi:acetyl-CoA carboxylase biotin carboxyl carrier protein
MKESREPRQKRNSSSEPAIPGVEFGQLERLLDFMAAHGLEEFEYEHAGLRIRLRKATSSGGAAPRSGAAPQALQPQPAPPAAAATPSPEAAPPEPAAAAAEELHIVKSPIVGTFYAAASPGTPPFVKVGDIIQAGQVVCIVEAMKLMNEIESDIGGEVVRPLVENGQPVEYGQGLFAIRPTKKK